jgi:hypothetical protein
MVVFIMSTDKCILRYRDQTFFSSLMMKYVYVSFTHAYVRLDLKVLPMHTRIDFVTPLVVI